MSDTKQFGSPPDNSLAPQVARTRGEAFSALLRAGISHGAFRVWHCLRDHENRRTGKCCPGYRTLAEEIHCSQHSIKGWLDELKAAGWLDWEVTTSRPTIENPAGRSNSYTLLDGCGRVLPKGTASDAVKADSAGCCQTRHAGAVKTDSGPLSKQTAELSNKRREEQEPLKPIVNRLSVPQRISMEKERDSLPETIRCLEDGMKYVTGDAVPRIREKIRDAKARLEKVQETLEAAHA